MKHVCILNGIHRGAVIKIDEGPVLVGGSDDCDCLLSDISVDGSSVRIALNAEGVLTAEAVEGTVLRNGRRMRAGKARKLDAGTIIGLGAVEMAIGSCLSQGHESAALRTRRRMLVSGGAVCAACIGVFTLISIIGGPADAYNSTTLSTASPTTSGTAQLQRDPMTDLARVVGRSDLAPVIDLRRIDTGQIMATGAVSDGERQRWNEIVRWFDGRYGDTTALTSRLSERNDDYVMPFRIKSVHAAPNPRVILQGGMAYPIGSILPGGWELRDIAEMKIELVRGSESLKIAF